MQHGSSTTATQAGRNNSQATHEPNNEQSARHPGFIRIAKSNSLLGLSLRQSFLPIAVISGIFFLWGFSLGIIDIFYWKFQQATHSSNLALVFRAAYFGAYLFGPIVVAWPCLEGKGFKTGLIVGVSIFWFAMLLFWHSTVLVSLPALLVATSIAGLGAAVVETTADLFVTLCGPPSSGAVRLSITKGIQATGQTISSVIFQRTSFMRLPGKPGVIQAQSVFLVLATVPLLVVVACYCLQLPNASKEDLKELAHRSQRVKPVSVHGIRTVWVTPVLGALSQVCNVGAQVACQAHMNSFVTSKAAV